MPDVSVIAHILPIAVIVEIVDTGNVFTYVVVTRIPARRIVVVRIVEIRVVIAITTIIGFRITRAIVIVDQIPGLIRFDARHYRGPVALTWNLQVLALLHAARTPLTHDLGLAAESGGDRIAVVIDCYLIEAGLFQIDGAARRRDFKQITRRDRSDIEEC